MISDNLLFKVIQFAYDAHDGQVDKQGKPYILHPLRVCLSMSDNDLRVVAILHDVLEDTCITVDDLRFKLLLPEDIVADVIYLSKPSRSLKTTYVEYIKQINIRGGRAKKVKIADIQDNFSRLPSLELIDKSAADRLYRKYTEALKILKEYE